MEPIITLLVIGALGGVARSFLGYKYQADEGEKFDVVKMMQSVAKAALAGTILVMGTSTLLNSPVTAATYVQAFFLAVGSDVMLKEGVGL